jgi:hypothetical protein
MQLKNFSFSEYESPKVLTEHHIRTNSIVEIRNSWKQLLKGYLLVVVLCSDSDGRYSKTFEVSIMLVEVEN